MSDRNALVAAILAAPDDDLPRLVFADYLEENGDEEYARFIRGQVERAKTPAWEPFAVRWDRGLVPGADPNTFRNRLPNVVDDWNVEWDLIAPFRRGLGSAIRVRDLYTFLDSAPQLFDSAPVSEIAVPTAPLDAWRRFARQSWLPSVKAIRFAGLSTPIEPIRCLCESPLATGLEEIYFDRANSPAMPELVAAIANSPLRQQLRGLHFRIGFESVAELITALGSDPWPLLHRLSFVTMGITARELIRLGEMGFLAGVRELNLSNNPLERNISEILLSIPSAKSLETLVLRNLAPNYDYDDETREEGNNYALPSLRILDWSANGGRWYSNATNVLRNRKWYPFIQSLQIAHTNISDEEVYFLTHGDIWPNLVELDLTQNSLGREGIDWLLYSEIPRNLAWIGLPDCRKNVDVGEVLQRKFAGRITSTESTPPPR